MEYTQLTATRVPITMLENAREQWPEIRDAKPGNILRFALALALTGNREDAIKATVDRRYGPRPDKPAE